MRVDHKVIECIIDFGANINIQDLSGYTALDIANNRDFMGMKNIIDLYDTHKQLEIEITLNDSLEGGFLQKYFNYDLLTSDGCLLVHDVFLEWCPNHKKLQKYKKKVVQELVNIFYTLEVNDIEIETLLDLIQLTKEIEMMDIMNYLITINPIIYIRNFAYVMNECTKRGLNEVITVCLNDWVDFKNQDRKVNFLKFS